MKKMPTYKLVKVPSDLHYKIDILCTLKKIKIQDFVKGVLESHKDIREMKTIEVKNKLVN